ncbi:hypothetical protein [Pseudomonas sp. EA_5y_Pfl2_R50]|uniref:hypothetical protein n=1 Tax=Pseudomonas sp. EA_5y_Pfl2_R50 TaxID=3088691 RepID=UPI0030DA7911
MSTETHALNLTAPKLLEAYGTDGNRLNVNDVYTNSHVNVQVPKYVGMLKGQTIRVRWTSGRYVYETQTSTVGTPAPQVFRIPRIEVIDAIGGLVALNYSVRTASGLPLQISKALTLRVDPQPFDLVEPRLSEDRKIVTVKFLNMTTGFTAKVRWHGIVVRDTESKPILNDSSIPFSIPASWVSENAGKTVLINYSVHRSGSNANLIFSKALRLNL